MASKSKGKWQKQKAEFDDDDDDDNKNNRNSKPDVYVWWPTKGRPESTPQEEDSSSPTDITLKFITKQDQYAIPQVPIDVKDDACSTDLDQLIKFALTQAGYVEKIPSFSYMIGGRRLVDSIASHLKELDLTSEAILEVEYFEQSPPPKPKDNLQHDDWVSSVMSCGDYLITGCYDKTVHLWSVCEGKKGLGKNAHKFSFRAHRAPVKAVAWLETTGTIKTFISCSIDQRVSVWYWNSETNDSKMEWLGRGHTESIECLSVERHGSRFATGASDNTIKIWDKSSGPSSCFQESAETEESEEKKTKWFETNNISTPIMTLGGHSESVSGVDWMDSNQLISSSWDHSIRMWDLTIGGMASRITGNVSFLCLAYSPLNRLLLTGCADRIIRLYDPRASDGFVVKNKYTNHRKWVPSVKWSPSNENLFVSGSYDNHILVWDRRSPNAPLYELYGHNMRILAVDWSYPKHIASGGTDSKTLIFEVE